MRIDQFVIIFMFPIVNSNTAATTTTTVDQSAVAAAAEAMDADCISRSSVNPEDEQWRVSSMMMTTSDFPLSDHPQHQSIANQQ